MAIQVLVTERQRMTAAVAKVVQAFADASMFQHEVFADINVNKPYKPRKLKQDTYHHMMREARKHKPHNSTKEAQAKRKREKWITKNKQKLHRRADFVREQRKHMGLK